MPHFALLLACLTATCHALTREDVTFYAPFEGSLKARIATGSPDPVGDATPKPEFTPGVAGQAVVTGDTLDNLISYQVAGHLNEHRGAISLWFKPINWRSGDGQQHVILSIGGRMLLYHYWESGAFSFYWMNGSSVAWGPGYIYESAVPNQWRHVAVSWGDGKCTVYFDGKRRGEAVDMPADIPAWADGQTFRLAQPDWTRDGNNLTAIDELMIFRNPLAAQEVSSLYRRLTVDTPPPALRVTSSDPATVTDFVDGTFGNLTRDSVTATLRQEGPGLSVSLHAEPSEGAVLELWARLPGQGGQIVRVSQPDPAGSAAFVLPWQDLGLQTPPAELALNIVRRKSDAPGDLVSWADVSTCPTGPEAPRAYGRVLLPEAGPVVMLRQLGPLHYAQLDLQAYVLGQDPQATAQVSLQPSDLKEITDPATFVKTYSGTRIALDPPVIDGAVKAQTSFSDTDINCLDIRLTDAAGVIYEARRPFVALPPVTTTLHPFPRSDRLEIHADVSDYREAPLDRLSLHSEALAADGATLVQWNEPRLTSVKPILTLALAAIPIGKHTIRTTLLQDGQAVSSFDAPFERIARGQWENSELGRDDIVVPPFTPVRVEGQSVSVWGRTYTFRDSLFPVQIGSAGQDLLAAPIELLPMAGVAGETDPSGRPNAATVRIAEHSDSHAVVECTGRLGDRIVVARHTIEYDGMCLTRLQVSGPGNLPGLTLAIPLKPESSTLYHHFLNAGLVRGTTVRGRGVDLKGQADLGFTNALWLGSEERGLTWFCESAAGWILSRALSPLSIRAREQDSLLLVRIAAASLPADRSIDATFGVIATPVKPMRDNWRFMRAQRDWSYGWCGPGSFTQSNNDITNVLPGWKATLAEQLKRVPLFVPYQRPDWINTKVPEATYFRDEWQSVPPYIAGSDDGSPNTHLSACLGSEWQDFLLYHLMRAYDDNGMVGFYFDGALPQPCKNTTHGHGWTDAEGNLQQTYPILAYREFYKRLAVECTKRGRPYLIWVHCSNCLEMPTLSFCDMTWDGEQFSVAATEARDYAKLFTLPYFRAEFLGQPFGLPVQWLVEFFNKPDKPPIDRAALDTALLFALVHGVGDNTLASNIPTAELQSYVREVLDAQDAFGIREPDAEFIPYWQSSGAVTLSPRDDNLACSIWKRPGKALLILANATPDTQEVTARLDLARLDLAGAAQGTDLVGKGKHTLANGELRLTMLPSTWRAICVEPATLPEHD